MHEVLVNRVGGLSLPGKSVVRLTDSPNMTLDVYRGRKTTTQQQHTIQFSCQKLYFKAYPVTIFIPQGAVNKYKVSEK